MYKVQTPQCFLSADIKEAYTQEFSEFFTDDSSVFESNAGKITTIKGEEKNLKINTEEDLKIAEIFMQYHPPFQKVLSNSPQEFFLFQKILNF